MLVLLEGEPVAFGYADRSCRCGLEPVVEGCGEVGFLPQAEGEADVPELDVVGVE